MQQVDWYFDFISPFAYLACHRLAEIEAQATLRHHPVLFAGLLGHWEHKGPAEIPLKRTFTYRHSQWLAQRAGIPFRMPAPHPFNPLAYLRLCIALDAEPTVVRRIFDFLWQQGLDPADPATFAALCAELDVDDGEARVADPGVKQRLKDNTDQAIARGVFGVPTFVVGDELFWGFDAIDFLLDFLADPALMHSEAMQQVGQVSFGASRR